MRMRIFLLLLLTYVKAGGNKLTLTFSWTDWSWAACATNVWYNFCMAKVRSVNKSIKKCLHKYLMYFNKTGWVTEKKRTRNCLFSLHLECKHICSLFVNETCNTVIKPNFNMNRITLTARQMCSHPEEWCESRCFGLSGGSPAPLSAAGTAEAAPQIALPGYGNNYTQKGHIF